QDRVHEAGLALDATVLLGIPQLDTVPLVGRRCNAGGVDIRERCEDLLERALVFAANVRYRDNRVAIIQEGGKGNRRIQRASVLLELLAVIGDDLVTWHRS